MRWAVEVNLEERGAVLRAEYITRHRRGRDLDLDDYGWYGLGLFRVLPRIQVLARQEDFRRPSIGVSRRNRATTVGGIWEIAPQSVRLLLDVVRRVAGPTQARTTSVIGQLQVRF